jgi:hypothetical protein
MEESTMRAQILLVAGFLLVVTVTEARATAIKENLKGLRGFWVLVQMDGPDLEKDHLVTPDLLRTRLELKLREAGINIFPAPESPGAAGKPLLMLAVTARRVDAVKAYNVSVLLGVLERVILERDKSRIIEAMTWKYMSFGLIGFQSVHNIYDLVSDAADVLINDYLAANPK